MKRAGKVLAYVALGLVSVLVVGISLTIGWRPFIGPRARPLTGRKFDPTPERLARGKYLVEAVGGCMACHSPHEWTKHDRRLLGLPYPAETRPAPARPSLRGRSDLRGAVG